MLFKRRKENENLEIQNLKESISSIKLDNNKINEKFTKEISKLNRIIKYSKEDEIQLSFFSNDNSKQNNLDKTLDNITNKYGISSITRASKLNVDINYKENQDNKKRI